LGSIVAAGPAAAYSYKNCSLGLYSGSYFTAFANCNGDIIGTSIATRPQDDVNTTNNYDATPRRSVTTRGFPGNFFGGSMSTYVGGYVLTATLAANQSGGCQNQGNNIYLCIWQYN